MKLLAIDPGNVESALVEYDTGDGYVRWFAKLPNGEASQRMFESPADRLAVEMIASYGMPVGAEVFETCVWVGRFIERWNSDNARDGHELVYRREVKLHLCNSARAKDGNVRQALIDRWGGKDKAIGKKASPGPLYGISGDVWAALGVAVTVAER